MIPALLLVTVLATSILSGVIGMAGGMMLMAAMTLVLSIPVAMMLHGVTQTGANGSRAWFLRHAIQWQIMGPYLAGVGACVAGFSFIALVPERSVVLMLVGALPWLTRLMPRRIRLDVTRPGTALICGAVVTGAQLLAGVSGPLLDVFFVNSRLDRHQIVATKAFTQTLGHLTKLGYYGTLTIVLGDGLVLTDAAPPWLFAAVVPVALLGTRIGIRLLDRLEEDQFRRASEWLILAMGTACSITGLGELLLG